MSALVKQFVHKTISTVEYITWHILDVYLNVLVRSSFSLVDFSFNFFIGFSIRKGWRKECETLSLNHIQQIRPIFRLKPGDIQLDQLEYLHEKYLPENEPLLYESKNKIVDIDNQHICIAPEQEICQSTLLYRNHLYLIPLAMLSKVEDCQNPVTNLKLMLVSSTRGSRSEILLQSLKGVPGTKVIEEIDGAVLAIEKFRHGRLTIGNLKQVLPQLILLEISKTCSMERKISRLIVSVPQPECFDQGMFAKISKIYPQTQRLFFTRSPKDSLEYLNAVQKISPIPNQPKNPVRSISYKLKSEPINTLTKSNSNSVENECQNFSETLNRFLCEKNTFNKSILFESLLEKPAHVMTAFFTDLGIPMEQVTEALMVVLEKLQEGSTRPLERDQEMALENMLRKKNIEISSVKSKKGMENLVRIG